MEQFFIFAPDVSAAHAQFHLDRANNVERAIDFVFSHPEGPPATADQPVAAPTAPAGPAPTNNKAAQSQPTDGAAQYELYALVSHIGKQATSGHYVCHVRKGGQWLFFNDEKVVVSQKPPKQFATMYFYRRKGLPK